MSQSPLTKPKKTGWLSAHSALLSWTFTAVVVLAMIGGYMWRPGLVFSAASETTPTPTLGPALQLPDLPTVSPIGLERQAVDHTAGAPKEWRDDPIDYTVQTGDSIFGIAKQFGITPETVMWANYDVLKDNPDMLSIGQTLKIPPTTGILYQWQDGDTLEAVAGRYGATVEDILTWPGNHLDISNPEIKTGTYIMIPNGHREFVQWIVPIVARGKAGVIKNILGPGGCDVSGGAVGSGAFIWPSYNHYLSGNDFSSFHLGIDIAAGMGSEVWAADTGVVVYAGAISGGYGNMVMIDHGNGYQTLYAHLSRIMVTCGQSVYRGQLIAYSGSTGNSTGPHLHFEVRYNGGFVNPWKVLPAP
jgi:murein DD-endopeptidase MepM/ murein hydrolase activator NlpD